MESGVLSKMRTKMVILDWAGTTVDYGCFAPVNAFKLAFEKVGITPTVEEIRKPMGMLKRDHIGSMLEEERIKNLWQEQNNSLPGQKAIDEIYRNFETSLMESLSEYAKPKKDALIMVEWLRSHGIFIGSTTGYTDSMMEIVVKGAEDEGYSPDAWFSPDSVGGLGRPFPYMIFENMRKFSIDSVKSVIKVGDTISDIKEGKNAGVTTLGVLEGSSLMGLSEDEYKVLTEDERWHLLDVARKKYFDAGADGVLLNLTELKKWIK